jgi:hypothetical protein
MVIGRKKFSEKGGLERRMSLSLLSHFEIYQSIRGNIT